MDGIMATANRPLQAIVIGVIAGMRSMSAPALVSHRLAGSQSPVLAASNFRILAAPPIATLLKVFAVGELIVDKLPFTPDRIAAGPLFGRIASGALSGAAFYTAQGRGARTGAILGGLGALGGAYAFYWLRRWLGKQWRLPDPLLGLAEDGLVIAAASAIIQPDSLSSGRGHS
jgi:uncharacterized membrane protein